MSKFTLITLFVLSNIQILSAQKITIFFDNTLSTTPSVSKAPLKYNKDFAYSLTLDDATSDAFTHALPLLRGGSIKEFDTPFTGFSFTDGCGNDVPFRAGIAWNSVSFNGNDNHNGDVQGIMTWHQLDSLYDYGWDVFNHSYSHKSVFTNQMNTLDYVNEVVKNQAAVREKTVKHIEMPVFVVPSGDITYQDIALQTGYKVVFDQAGNNLIGFGGLQVDGDLNLNGLKIHRQKIEESIYTPNLLENVVTKSQNGGHYWYNEFTHRIDNFNVNSFNFYSFKNQIQKIANGWGNNGSDRVLMAPLQEVFEYLVLRQTIKMTTLITGQKMEITFDLSQVPTWLRRKTLTLVVNSNTTFSRVDVPTNIKKTFKGIGNQKIINIDFSQYTTSTPTKDLTTPSVLRVFPNPAGGFLNIELLDNLTESANLTITDVSGKVYLTGHFFVKKYQQNIQSLPKGMYILNIRQGTQISTTKFYKN